MTPYPHHRPHAAPGVQPQRINLNDKASTHAWTLSLGVSLEQLRWAIAAVGDTAINVTAHLQHTPPQRPSFG